MNEELREYNPLPTMQRFHDSPAQIRCIVGPVGSGKTSAAAWEICYYLPQYLFDQYQIKHTRWVVVRNTYRELIDTTVRTIVEWFPFGTYRKQDNDFKLSYGDFEVEILFRSCDSSEDIKKFKSLEITGYWIDESIEVDSDIKRMLKTRIGRLPPVCPGRWGIETTNPPDVEHPTYSEFAWDTPPPGPMVSVKPLENHIGFWQPPGENNANLRPGYYDDLRNDYRDNQDWVDTFIEAKPGITIRGKLVYRNFKRAVHVAEAPLVWANGPLIRGWDNSGNSPACILLQVPRGNHIQVMKEWHVPPEKSMGIVDFANIVTAQCNVLYPGAVYTDWADPAGFNQYSTKEGGLTSNADLMRSVCQVPVRASDQNWEARREAVERQLGQIDGILIDPGCVRLINGFIGGYCYQKIGVGEKYGDKPEKNKFSHVHDALQYAVVKLVGSRRAAAREITADMDFDVFDPFKPRPREISPEEQWSPYALV